MRVLHFVSALSGGGAERQLRYLAKQQALEGLEVHVGYLTEGPEVRTPQDWAGVELHSCRASGNYSFRLLTDAHRIVTEVQPDLVQTWIAQFDVVLSPVARYHGVPWIIREPNTELKYRDSWKATLRKCVGRWCTAVVANSNEGLKVWGHLKSRKPQFVVRNGIPLQEIRAAPPGPNEWDFAAGRKRFLLYAGRLEPHKRADLAIRALRPIRNSWDIGLLICGEGSARANWEKIARQEGVQGSVDFLGVVPPERVWSLMKGAIALVSPSRYEGMPNTVMEAMACGCPVVVSEIPSHKELIAQDEGWFARGDDEASLMGAVRECVLGDRASWNRCQRAQRKISQYSIELMCQRYRIVYDAIMSGGVKADRWNW